MRVVFFLFVVPSGFVYGVNGDLGRGLLRFCRKLMLQLIVVRVGGV